MHKSSQDYFEDGALILAPKLRDECQGILNWIRFYISLETLVLTCFSVFIIIDKLIPTLLSNFIYLYRQLVIEKLMTNSIWK